MNLSVVTFVNTLTTVEGKELTLISKLESESGIDLEYLRKCALVSDTLITYKFKAYGKYFELGFPLDDGKVLIGKSFRALNQESKALIVLTLVKAAMQSGVPRDTIIKQQQAFRAKSVGMVKNSQFDNHLKL